MHIIRLFIQFYERQIHDVMNVKRQVLNKCSKYDFNIFHKNNNVQMKTVVGFAKYLTLIVFTLVKYEQYLAEQIFCKQ